jgi:DNA ligase-1
VTVDIIKEGKNKGKKTETTPVEQAHKEAKQQWDKKVKKGYVEDLDRAKLGETDSYRPKPMLAEEFQDYRDIVQYPVFTQPKLDGIRCQASYEESVELYTREGNPIISVPHIVEQLQTLWKAILKHSLYPQVVPIIKFDGELYNHIYSSDFDMIKSIVKREKSLHDEYKTMEYHIYDVVLDSASFADRRRFLDTIETLVSEERLDIPNIKFVLTDVASSEKELEVLFEEYLEKDYEGLMVRWDNGYQHKRTKYLLKYKIFDENEFEIVDILEGRGNLMGHAGRIVCKTKDSKDTFGAKKKGKRADLKEMFENKEKYIGKLLTVKHFKYTPDGKPRFPSAKTVRDYE